VYIYPSANRNTPAQKDILEAKMAGEYSTTNEHELRPGHQAFRDITNDMADIAKVIFLEIMVTELINFHPLQQVCF
jgi:hypothetical protein